MFSRNIPLHFSYFTGFDIILLKARICFSEAKHIADNTGQSLINYAFVCFIAYEVLQLQVSHLNEIHIYNKHIGC
jgi:hypothetical protein